MSDGLYDGTQLRTFNVIDHFNREGLAIEVDTSLTGPRVIRVFEQLKPERSEPRCRLGSSRATPVTIPVLFDHLYLLVQAQSHHPLQLGDLLLRGPGDLRVRLRAARDFHNHLELELGRVSASVLLGRTYQVHPLTLSKSKKEFLEKGAEVFGGGEEVWSRLKKFSKVPTPLPSTIFSPSLAQEKISSHFSSFH